MGAAPEIRARRTRAVVDGRSEAGWAALRRNGMASRPRSGILRESFIGAPPRLPATGAPPLAPSHPPRRGGPRRDSSVASGEEADEIGLGHDADQAGTLHDW